LKRRVPALVAALALFAMLIPLTTAVVFAWAPPTIASVCSNDSSVNNWTITLAHESDYNMQWADNSSFSGATNVTMAQGVNALATPSSVTTLYVRWASDHNSSSHATWSGGTCSTPSPSPTAFQSVPAPTGTPVVTAPPTTPPTQAPTDTPVVTAPPTTPPTQAPTDTPVVTAPPTTPPTQAPTDTPVVGAPRTDPPTPAPTDTPFESFQGETATPIVSDTPFESFQGETATPPPTGTTTPGSSSGNSTPLFALLICVIFGGIGLAAAQLQRRTIRR
jgi:hypothetical protein